MNVVNGEHKMNTEITCRSLTDWLESICDDLEIYMNRRRGWEVDHVYDENEAMDGLIYAETFWAEDYMQDLTCAKDLIADYIMQYRDKVNPKSVVSANEFIAKLKQDFETVQSLIYKAQTGEINLCDKHDRWGVEDKYPHLAFVCPNNNIDFVHWMALEAAQILQLKAWAANEYNVGQPDWDAANPFWDMYSGR